MSFLSFIFHLIKDNISRKQNSRPNSEKNRKISKPFIKDIIIEIQLHNGFGSKSMIAQVNHTHGICVSKHIH